MPYCRILAAICVLIGAAASAHAQTSGPFELNWPHPGEKLVYQSRGCADECWEATAAVACSDIDASVRNVEDTQ